MVVKIERLRYFLVVFYGPVPEIKLLVNGLRKQVSLLGGQISLAKSAIHVIDCTDSYAIIRSTHESRDLVESAIQLLSFPETIPSVLTVSGTLKKINHYLNTNYEDEDL